MGEENKNISVISMDRTPGVYSGGLAVIPEERDMEMGVEKVTIGDIGSWMCLCSLGKTLMGGS